MALDGTEMMKGADNLFYQCPNAECTLPYDGYNCVNCSFKNETGYPGELIDDGPDALYGNLTLEIKATVKDTLSKEGLKKGVLEIGLSDPWVPQSIFINYEITVLDNKRELANELPGIEHIKFEVQSGTSNFLIEMLEDSGINIEDAIRKAFYGEK